MNANIAADSKASDNASDNKWKCNVFFLIVYSSSQQGTISREYWLDKSLKGF